MLWACLRFPRLALDAVRGEDRIAVAAADCRHRWAAAAPSRRARRRRGARSRRPRRPAADGGAALCPALSTRPRDPAAERQALDSIAAWAYRFSADVSIAGPDAILLEIGASLTLFGGLAALLRRLRFEIAAFGFDYSLAARRRPRPARTCSPRRPTASRFQRCGPLVNALGAVPLATSGLDDEAIAALRGMGFRNSARSVPPAARRARAAHRPGRARSSRSHARHSPPKRCCAIGRRIASSASSNSRSASNRRARSRFALQRLCASSRRSSSRATAACSASRSCSATSAARRRASKSACSRRSAMRRRCSSSRARGSSASSSPRRCMR